MPLLPFWESCLFPEPGLLLLSPKTRTLLPFPAVLAAGQVTLKGVAITLGPAGLSTGSMPKPLWLSSSGDCRVTPCGLESGLSGLCPVGILNCPVLCLAPCRPVGLSLGASAPLEEGPWVPGKQGSCLPWVGRWQGASQSR